MKILLKNRINARLLTPFSNTLICFTSEKIQYSLYIISIKNEITTRNKSLNAEEKQSTLERAVKNISALNSGNTDKFDFPASKEMSPPQSLIISESETFYYCSVGQMLDKQIKTAKG